MNGSNQRDEKRKPEFDTWLLHLPPVNLYNVDLVWLAFGYDRRYELKEKHKHDPHSGYYQEG